ncbi:hypothetical protein F7725_006069 [Dissostichus mawsoni]|uniref:Uncharacterized protein n=1 Tax=Dissostichus mawsoni TaxID=36200 RepID=A0A7J5YSZ6_DISMA|nr:hypothetical protein F7725_006069 [Dissostichus mawsoni]
MVLGRRHTMEKQPLPTDDGHTGAPDSGTAGFAGDEIHTGAPDSGQLGSLETRCRRSRLSLQREQGGTARLSTFWLKWGSALGSATSGGFHICAIKMEECCPPHPPPPPPLVLRVFPPPLCGAHAHYGDPLFFLELAAGQAIRQGSIGVWKFISPRLAGIGYSSLPECKKSSPTSYFWYRKALNITHSIDETGSFNPYIIGCLLAAWTLVCLGIFKGIKTSVKVMYFSSIFPYVVLFCFLVRGLMLDGALEGIGRRAATQVFFSLGLGFGSIIAYSSYNPKNNNCHRDAFTVPTINFLTSVLATLVVFAVLGFRAKNKAVECVVSNIKELSEQFRSGPVEINLMPSFNYSDPSAVALEDYRAWFKLHGNQFPGNLTDCDLEKEMQQGVEGTGLAFIAFTEAISLLPGSPFWSALFFLMLLNLGLSTICIISFIIGLLFTQRCGNYFVMMFDDYAATLPLIIVVVLETFSVSWLYGADRFLDDIEGMLGWRPHVIYKYLWKYVCLLAMLGLLGATTIRMFIKRPTYGMEPRELVISSTCFSPCGSEEYLEYPDWALAVMALLIIFAVMPVPIALIHAVLMERTRQRARDSEAGQYSIVSTGDKCETPMTDISDLDRSNGTAAS